MRSVFQGGLLTWNDNKNNKKTTTVHVFGDPGLRIAPIKQICYRQNFKYRRSVEPIVLFVNVLNFSVILNRALAIYTIPKIFIECQRFTVADPRGGVHGGHDPSKHQDWLLHVFYILLFYL